MAENILLIRFKSIGDVVFTLPAVNALRDNFPAARITFLTSKENAALVRGFREVNNIIALDRAALRSGNPLKVLPEFFGLIKKLRAGKFSHVVDFQGYGETAWLTRLTGAPERWGNIYNQGRRWAYTRGFTRTPRIHPADWNLSLLQQCGLKIGKIKNEFTLSAEASLAAKDFLTQNGISASKPILFIQPLTSTPEKNWPLENYLAVARHWQARDAQIVFGGGPADRAALQPVVAEKFCVSAGVPLLTTAGLMKLSTVICGGDTGALHLAVAMKKPVLMLMQEAIPGSPTPYQFPDSILTPNNLSKIDKISIEAVNSALTRSFAEQENKKAEAG